MSNELLLKELTYVHPGPGSNKDYTLDDNLSIPKGDSVLRRLPAQDLDSLNAPPLEVVLMILSQLDLSSLTDFRRVN